MVVFLAANLLMIFSETYLAFVWAMFLVGMAWNFSFLSSCVVLGGMHHAEEKHMVHHAFNLFLFIFVSVFACFSGAIWHWIDEPPEWRNCNILCLMLCTPG